MSEYLIHFNGEWVPADTTIEEFQAKIRAVSALIDEMKEAGVFVFAGGLDPDTPVFSADASSGAPLFSDGPFIESKEHLGGFTIVEAADDEAAKLWAGKLAVACGWPQEVHRFQPQPSLED